MVADGLLKDIATADVALRDGLALVAAGGERDKVAKPHYRRSDPARERLRREADRLFFPELWRRVAAREDADFTRMRLAFLKALADIARREFVAALPSIPCAGIVRPRAEVRGRARMESRLREAMQNYQRPEAADA
jgi:CRISPR system Cascade subunit CasA